MKTTLLFLFLATLGLNAQTSMSFADISAQAGNAYETLLTNVEYGYNDGVIQSYLQKIGMIHAMDIHDIKLTNGYIPHKFKKNILTGNEKQAYVQYRMYIKTLADGTKLTTKVEIWGDWRKVVEFFCGFWSRSLNFEDVKPGEVVSTRFLSDIATLSFPSSNTAKITVLNTYDYYGGERPKNNETATFSKPPKPVIKSVGIDAMSPDIKEGLLAALNKNIAKWLDWEAPEVQNLRFELYLRNLGNGTDADANPEQKALDSFLYAQWSDSELKDVEIRDTLHVVIKDRRVTITE